jgi:hypothetical protein
MAAELFGLQALGRALGIVLAADGVAEATAPVLIGHMRDVSGSYLGGFALLVAFAVAGALAIGLLPSRGATHTASGVSTAPEPA